MMKLEPTRPFLDEAGHVYLPLAGPGRSCLRLNAIASDLFRRWVKTPFDRASLSEGERAFLDKLIACGAVAEGKPS